jgi:hypothetical protein
MMNWKKIADSSELIVFEKDLESHKLKIEARRIDNGWEVFKTKVEGSKSDLLSEHILENKHEALELIDKLKDEKEEKSERKPSPKVSLKRIYKEEFVEKWFFSINEEPVKNFVIIRYDNIIRADIVMHEAYAINERDIVAQIEEKLGLPEFGEAVVHEIYYFKRYNKISQKKQQADANFIDVEFDSDEEFY